MITAIDTYVTKNRMHCVSNRVDVLYSTNKTSSIITLQTSNVYNAYSSGVQVQFKMDTQADGLVYKDLAKIIKRKLSFDFESTALAWVPAYNSCVYVSILAIDSDNVPSVLNYSVIENSYLFTDEWIDSVFEANENRLCIKNKTANKIQLLQNFVLHINNYARETMKIVIKTYNGSILVSTYNMYSPDIIDTLAQRYMLDVGTFNLAQQFGVSIFTGVDNYTAHAENAGGIVSDIIKFQLDNNCYQSETVRVHWLNSRGGFDAFNFTMGNLETRNSERLQYEKANYTISSSEISDNLLNSFSFYSTKNKTFKATSDWLTETESRNLIELFESPVVILEKNNTFSTITINSINQDLKTLQNNKIINYELSYTINDNKHYTI